jgi:GGDEF domain-containing protein
MGTMSGSPADGVTGPAAEPDRSAASRPRRAELAAALETLESRPGADVTGTLTAAEEIEREAHTLGDLGIQMRARLVQGDMLDRIGDPAGPRLVLTVNRWAAGAADLPLLARSHLLLSTTFHNLGDPAGCLDHAVRALEALDEEAPARVRAQYLTTLADALGWVGSFDDARARYLQAEALLIAVDDHRRQVNVLNNLAYTEYEAGEPQRAWETAERMRSVADSNGLVLDATAIDTTARALIGLGRYADAVHTIQAHIADPDAPDYEQADTLAENLLTLAEAQRLLGHLDQARDSLDRCDELTAQRDLGDVRVRVLAARAELYAAAGDTARAFATYKAFHASHAAQHSVEREAQARARQALFETAEARAQAERFREQALRDPLTRLYNRRHVDEHLPAVLVRAAQTGTPVTAALLDLDHFKRINDTLSHDVGDRVLVTFAGLLAGTLPAGTTGSAGSAGAAGSAGSAGAGGFAARIGGEEFLLVLTGIGPGEAVDRLEKLRLTVAGYPWRSITGDVPVTVSVGVTTAYPESTKESLLARADHALYTAKRDGRDRVHVDDAAVLERRRYRPARRSPGDDRSR